MNALAGRGRRFSNRASSSGFSIIELLIVVGMILVLATMSLPNLSSMMAGYSLDGAARGFSSILQRVHFNAISDTTSYRVLVYPSTAATNANSYKIQRRQPQPPFQLTAGATYVDVAGVMAMPQGVRLSSSAPLVNGLPAITFNSSGDVVDSAGNVIGNEVYVMVTNTRGGTRKVWISGTSRVRIE